MLTKKVKKVAPIVEKTTKSKKADEVPSPEQPQKAIPIDLSKVDPEKIKMAEELGVPVGQILNWMGTVEARFNALEQNLPVEIKKAMDKSIAEAQEKQQAAYKKAVADGTATPPSGKGQIVNQIVEGLKALGGGGGGMDEDMKARYKKMMDLQFDRLQADVSFSRTMENYVKSQFAAKLGKKITEGLEP